MVVGATDISDLTSMVSFTFAMLRYLNRLASALFTSFRLAKFTVQHYSASSRHLTWTKTKTKFGWVSFADLSVQRLATKQNAECTEGAPKLRSYFYPFVDQSSSNFATM